MFFTSYLLAALAIFLAWPAPILLSKASWPHRSPGAAMMLWQAIALAGGLSMIGAFLCWGLAPLGDGLLPALGVFATTLLSGGSMQGLDVLHVLALCVAGLLGGHLLLTLARSAWRLGRQRQRHRTLLALLSERERPRPDTVVIHHPTPLAYCLPGADSLTVLSSGLVQALDEAELRAVLEHERAHVEQRHDLLLLAFESWHAALPWLPTTTLALGAVRELVEELADDAALRSVKRGELLGALAVVATASETDSTGTTPSGSVEHLGAPASVTTPLHELRAVGAGSPSEALTSARLRRLLAPQPPLSRAASASLVAVAAALVVAPTTGLIVAGWPIA